MVTVGATLENTVVSSKSFSKVCLKNDVLSCFSMAQILQMLRCSSFKGIIITCWINLKHSPTWHFWKWLHESYNYVLVNETHVCLFRRQNEFSDWVNANFSFVVVTSSSLFFFLTYWDNYDKTHHLYKKNIPNRSELFSGFVVLVYFSVKIYNKWIWGGAWLWSCCYPLPWKRECVWYSIFH